MRSGSPKARARAAALMLCRVTYDHGPSPRTGGRAFDDCFEMGDGDRVMEHLIALLREDSILSRDLRYALLPDHPARHYCPAALLDVADAMRETMRRPAALFP